MALVDKYCSASFRSSFLPKKARFEIGGVEKFDSVSVTSQLEPEIPQLARGVNVRTCFFSSPPATLSYSMSSYHHSASPLSHML